MSDPILFEYNAQQIVDEAREEYRCTDRRVTRFLIWAFCGLMVALSCGAVYMAGKHDAKAYATPSAIQAGR
jgi:hypothetical protein